MADDSSNIRRGSILSTASDPTNGMPVVQHAFKLPRIVPLEDLHQNNYLRWKYTLFLHLDWHQLRAFIDGSVSEPTPDADADVRAAFLRSKIMAYTILRDSVHDYLMEVFQIGKASIDVVAACLFNSDYDVKYLWDSVHDFVSPEIVC